METYLDVIIVLVRFAREQVVSLLNTSLQCSLAINNRLRLGVTVPASSARRLDYRY